MAIYNEILVPRYARALQKLFGTKGGVPTKQLAGEIMAVFPLFNGVENRYLDGWDRFAQGATQAGVALNQSVLRMRNPVGSNFIAVFEKIQAAETVADQPFLTITQTSLDLATPLGLTTAKLDPRGRLSSGLSFSRQATGASPASDATIAQAVFPATGGSYDFILFEDQEIPLLPGMAIQVQGNQVNVALSSNWMWRERGLEESERA